jgi:hypothetical protein
MSWRTRRRMPRLLAACLLADMQIQTALAVVRE